MRNLLDTRFFSAPRLTATICRSLVGVTKSPGWASQSVLLYMEKCWARYESDPTVASGWPTRRFNPLAEGIFFSVLNGSPIFARKCRKRWFAQSSLGRRVCLLPKTTFLHINALHGVYVVVPGHHTSAESLNSSSSPSPGGLFFITSWSSLSVLSSGMKNRWSMYFVTMYFFLSSLSEWKNICH